MTDWVSSFQFSVSGKIGQFLLAKFLTSIFEL